MLAIAALAGAPAFAEACALIVGINDYREIYAAAIGCGRRRGAQGDTRDFSVDLVLNADRREFNRAVSVFQSSR
jgi:hypothetical protein